MVAETWRAMDRPNTLKNETLNAIAMSDQSAVVVWSIYRQPRERSKNGWADVGSEGASSGKSGMPTTMLETSKRPLKPRTRWEENVRETENRHQG